MITEYEDLIKIDIIKINLIIKDAIEYIERQFEEMDTSWLDNDDDDDFYLDSKFIQMKESVLLEKLNVSEKAFYSVIYERLRLCLMKLQIKIENEGDKLYLTRNIGMRIYEMKGCIISDGELYRFHPDGNYSYYFKDYKKCEIIIREIKEK